MLGEFFFFERGAKLGSRAAHTHPKNTRVPTPYLANSLTTGGRNLYARGLMQ